MIGSITKLLGLEPKADLRELLKQGAQIIDVRTPAEYAEGHVKGSLNMPVDQLTRHLHRLRKGTPIITCCRSGARSAHAARELRDHGYDAHNGGPWSTVNEMLRR